MAASKKRRLSVSRNNSQNADNDSSNSSDEGLPEETVHLDLEAYNPLDDDFHGIKQLLLQLFLKAHIDVSDMANLLIEQNNVTSVLKNGDNSELVNGEDNEDDSDDDNYIFGVSSVLNIPHRKNRECIKQLKSYLLEKCEKNSTTEDYTKLKNFLEDEENHLGYILNERMINIPGQISVPIFKSLSDDMKSADHEKPKKKFNFSNYLIISKIYLDKTEPADSNVIHFVNSEEEIIMEDASFKFDFSVSDEKDTGLGGNWEEEDMEFEPKRRIMIFPAEKWDAIVDKLKIKFAQ